MCGGVVIIFLGQKIEVDALTDIGTMIVLGGLLVGALATLLGFINFFSSSD